ncbi:MAG TPA: condensation domain-containing protein [Streptosporangiaceae bacterium]|nr:condensation domain-containing protein [Streptosporangiaceae bacterium]
MTQTGRYPLSFTQQYFCSLDDGDLKGAFGNRFTIVSALRIAGHVDVPALQGALDDVVRRHELLRTVVVRDAQPPYQQVYPPCQVPLEIRDRPAEDRPRELIAEELIIEAEKSTMTPRQVPVMRATFTRFDDRDSVLVLVVHHSASDAWSQSVILRDLAAFYDARAHDRTPELPPVKQYREYAEWQRAGTADDSVARRYWREKLSGARVLALPNDNPRPEVYSRPFSAHNYVVSAEEMAATVRFARETRSSMFMVLLAAFSVFVHEMTGLPDPGIRAFTTGRNEAAFQNTMGLFMNLVPFRTDISQCASFREIVAATKDTCLDAYAHEVPISVIEQDLPDFNSPHDDPKNSQFVLGMFQSRPNSATTLPIADGARQAFKRTLPSKETSDIPSGMSWSMAIGGRSDDLLGNVVYNADEFGERKVAGWAADYNRILSRLANEPDREWRQLADLAR